MRCVEGENVEWWNSRTRRNGVTSVSAFCIDLSLKMHDVPVTEKGRIGG